MKKGAKFLIFFMASLYCVFANNNPFAPISDIQSARLPNFDKAEIKFNSNARVIKNIQIIYISFDGSEQVLNVDINKSIDWHDTFLLSKAKNPTTTQILDVSVTIPQTPMQNVNENNFTADIEVPSDSGKIEDFLSYLTYKNRIVLHTNDELIGNFIIGNPSKIVLDFRKDIAFNTKTMRLSANSPFEKISAGSHKGYYRLVLYLDGKYNYKIDKSGSYIIYLE